MGGDPLFGFLPGSEDFRRPIRGGHPHLPHARHAEDLVPRSHEGDHGSGDEAEPLTVQVDHPHKVLGAEVEPCNLVEEGEAGIHLRDARSVFHPGVGRGDRFVTGQEAAALQEKQPTLVQNFAGVYPPTLCSDAYYVIQRGKDPPVEEPRCHRSYTQRQEG